MGIFGGAGAAGAGGGRGGSRILGVGNQIFPFQPFLADYSFSFVGVETKEHYEFFFFDAPHH